MSWINRTQSSFSEGFYSVFTLEYFLFHHSPVRASKYNFANSTWKVLVKSFLRGSCNSLRWINRTQSSFSESFFPLFNGRYFLFHHSPLWASKYDFEYLTKTFLAKASCGESCNSVRCIINRTHGSFSESFFSVFNWRYFRFHHSPLWASKYHFANSTGTVLAKGFWKRKL